MGDTTMGDFTKLRNINRGYMKLDVWRKAMDLHRLVWTLVMNTRVDLRLRSQVVDSSLSIAANIAEGYGRRSIKEYLQYLYISLGSLSETFTRTVGLRTTEQISETQFQEFDSLHYEVENILLRLIESLEKKKDDGTWSDRIP